MMAESAKTPFDAPDWIFEIKLDGYRAITVFDAAGKPHLWSRNGLALEAKCPAVATAVSKLKLRSTILDGEVVAVDENGLHELGAVMAAALAAEVGWHALYIGPSLPAAEIAGVAFRRDARVVALSLVYPESDPNIERELRELRGFLPKKVTVLVGGRAAENYRSVIDEIGAMAQTLPRNLGAKIAMQYFRFLPDPVKLRKEARWSGVSSVPGIGGRVQPSADVGAGTGTAYFVDNGRLGVLVRLELYPDKDGHDFHFLGHELGLGNPTSKPMTA